MKRATVSLEFSATVGAQQVSVSATGPTAFDKLKIFATEVARVTIAIVNGLARTSI